MASPVRLRAATRGSPLARWQTDHVAALLAAAGTGIAVDAVVVETIADRQLDTQIWEMGGKGVFVKEVQAAVLDGRADIAVHSGKDLPAVGHPDLVIAAVPERADARDLLIGAALATLATGVTVATGSVRRRAQLSWLRPDLTFVGLRGNIATRLGRIPPGGAILMAAAAVSRLAIDLGDVEHEVLTPSVMLPQVAQGALVVECRRDDASAREQLRKIEHAPTRRAVDAERAFLAELGGDCDLPAAAYATTNAEGRLEIDALLASLDGHVLLRAREVTDDGEPTGRALARSLLDDAGGSALLVR